MTIGILAVARFAASVALLADVTITSGPQFNKSSGGQLCDGCRCDRQGGQAVASQERVIYDSMNPRTGDDAGAGAAREGLMPISSKYLFVVSMDVDADKEALFNEVYDSEHIPNLLKVSGVRAVTRMAGEHFAVSIGGVEKKVAHDGPCYSAIYEIDGPHILISPEWTRAVEEGRWPSQVRPFTHNRRHALYKVR